MKIAIVQFEPILGKPEQTINKLSSLFSSCNNADLIILPELANSGYNFNSKEEAFESSEELENGKFVNFLIEKAKKLNAGIVAGINERESDKLYNSAILVDETGVIGKYRKLHLFLNEPDFFEKGDTRLPIFDFKGYKIGMLICFDWMIPEIWRNMALNNVDLICHPSNLVLPYAQSVIPAYAIINHIFIATANRIGTERGVTFSGQSIVANPFGKIIGQLSKAKEEVLFCDIDLEISKNKNITERNHLFDDRRLDVFCDLK